MTTITMLQIGDQFDRYQIQSYLAQGGMSDIYRAFDLVSRREVVIKIPNQAMIGDPAQYERFQREMEIMAQIEHPAVLRGLGSGQYNRIPYLVTEYVDGKSLRQVMDLSGAFPPEKALPIIIRIAEGMAYCHDRGIIHRDLKPENILITMNGQPVIMDFGLARTKNARRVTYSNLTATMGTPDYMAPEQIEGQRGDARTDVYALGTVLYEMLAGQPPFNGDTPLAVMAQHLNATAPRLDHLSTLISPQLAAVVARCLLRNPDNRYASMSELVAALQDPSTADLNVLNQQADVSSQTANIEKKQILKGAVIAIAVIVGVIALAFLLQTLR